MFYFDLYHQTSKHKPGSQGDFVPYNAWPKEWKTIFYKTYPRLKKYPLPAPSTLPDSLSEVLMKRTSTHVFTRTHIQLTKLSTLLFYSLGQKPGQDKRMYGSAGARYPIEAYILLTQDADTLPKGTYHYSMTDHSVIQLSRELPDQEMLRSFSLDGSIADATCTIVLTGVFSRSVPKYKERAYRYCLIEVGEITQNLALCATALNIPSMSLGGVIDPLVEDHLDIDGVEESLLHAVCFG